MQKIKLISKMVMFIVMVRIFSLLGSGKTESVLVECGCVPLVLLKRHFSAKKTSWPQWDVACQHAGCGDEAYARAAGAGARRAGLVNRRGH